MHRARINPEVLVLTMVSNVMINYNYLIIDPGSRQAVVVDPAWDMDKIDLALHTHSAQLSGILITHSHRDHIDLAVPLSNTYGVPIWMSREEVEFSGFEAENLQCFDPNPWKVGALEIFPVHTPGHTPGCVCFHIGDNLFTGDVLFAEGCGIVQSIDAAFQMFDSLQLLKSNVDGHTRIYPGHSYGKKPGQFFSDVLNNNIYLQFTDKESFTRFRLRKGQSKKDFFKFS